MNYYKITLPTKTYVARGRFASAVLQVFYEENSFDEADGNGVQGFFKLEPLTENLTVKGKDAKEALEEALEECLKEYDDVLENLIKEYGEEYGKTVYEEEYPDRAAMIMILEADEVK